MCSNRRSTRKTTSNNFLLSMLIHILRKWFSVPLSLTFFRSEGISGKPLDDHPALNLHWDRANLYFELIKSLPFWGQTGETRKAKRATEWQGGLYAVGQYCYLLKIGTGDSGRQSSCNQEIKIEFYFIIYQCYCLTNRGMIDCTCLVWVYCALITRTMVIAIIFDFHTVTDFVVNFAT